MNTSWGRSPATCAIRCCTVHTYSDLGVSVMFPINSSVTRPLPSLLPGSDGTPSPAFLRYYEAATTAVVFRLCPPHFPALVQTALWLTSLWFARSDREVRRPLARWFFFPVSPISGHWSSRDLRRSQVPREPHCAFALLSDSGRALTPSLCGASVLSPSHETWRTSDNLKLSELYHTASALAVYASCRHC